MMTDKQLAALMAWVNMRINAASHTKESAATVKAALYEAFGFEMGFEGEPVARYWLDRRRPDFMPADREDEMPGYGVCPRCGEGDASTNTVECCSCAMTAPIDELAPVHIEYLRDELAKHRKRCGDA